jgi:hypothetical protein
VRACAILLLENAIAPQQSKPSVDISDARLNAAPLWTIHRHGPQRTRASTNSHNNQPHTPAGPADKQDFTWRCHRAEQKGFILSLGADRLCARVTRCVLY